MLGSRSINTLMVSIVQFDQNLGNTLKHSDRHHRLIGKRIYLIVNRPEITFVVGLLSGYMQIPH